MRRMAGIAFAALLVMSLSGTALAKGGGGKPGSGGGTGGTITSLVMVYDENANGAPNWGDKVTFTFSTSKTSPYIVVTCSQGGAMVYSSSHLMYWPNIWNDPGVFTLSSPAWSAGAASCKASLYTLSSSGSSQLLGSMPFSVGA